jgi:cytochrome c-type biogenesis protein CcmH
MAAHAASASSTPTPAPASPAAPATTTGSVAVADAEEGQMISVQVDVDPALASSIPANADLIVFARAKEGPPMPLAVKRMPAGRFPVTVMLSDSDAMMPSMKLSSFPQVYVTARISKDQDVRISAGELEGIGEALSINGEALATRVTINVQH